MTPGEDDSGLALMPFSESCELKDGDDDFDLPKLLGPEGRSVQQLHKKFKVCHSEISKTHKM